MSIKSGEIDPKKCPLIPKSKSKEAGQILFDRFDTEHRGILKPVEIIKFQQYLDRKFAGDYKQFKPPNIFKNLAFDENGFVTKEVFEAWVEENLTFDDQEKSLTEQG